MSHFRTNRTIISAAIAGAFGCAALPALAQTAPDASAAPTQTVTVSGFRTAAEDALNIKRSADGFVDAISADGLGRFPDLNVGEALARLPGVQIDRDAGDRNATISLRGLPGTFIKYTLNGMSLASPAISGSTPLGTFSSNVFSRFVVNKTPGSADPAGGVSGNVDLQMAGALARKDGGEATLSGEYNTLGKSQSPALTLKYNKHINPDLAIYGNVVYKDEKFRRDSLSLGYIQAYNPAAYVDFNNSFARITNIGDFRDYFAAPGAPAYTSPAGIAQLALNIKAVPTGGVNPTQVIGITQDIVGTGAKSQTGLFYMNTSSQNSRDAVGSNKSASFGAEMKVNRDIKANVAYLGAQRYLDQGTVYSISNRTDLGGARLNIDPKSVILTPDGNAYATAYDYENTQINSSASYQYNKTKVDALISSLVWNSGDWRAVTRLNLSRGAGNFDQTQTRLLFNQVGASSTIPFPANGVYGSMNTGAGDIGNYSWKLTPANPFTIPLAPLRLDNTNGLAPAVLATTSGSAWQIRGATPPGIGAGWVQLGGRNQKTVNRVNGFQQDAERDVSEVPYLNKVLKSVQAGIGYEQDKFLSSFYSITPYGANPDGINQSFVSGSYSNAPSFFGGTIGGFNANWQAANLDAIKTGLKPTAASLVPGQQLTPIGFPVVIGPDGWVSDPNSSDQFTKNFTNDYTERNLFLKANVDTQVFGIPLHGNVGMRHESTTKVIRLIDRVVSTVGGVQSVQYKPSEFRNDYAYNLPSLLMVADLKKDLLLRFAAYKTYVRPNRADENPTTSVAYSQNSDATRYNITLGRNELKPYLADSFDLGLEWYNRKGSMFAVAVYKKNLTGYIYNVDKISRPDLACPADGLFNGVNYGTGPLTYNANPATVGEECRAVNGDPNNLDSNGQPNKIIVTATGATNSTTPVKVSGAEFSMQQNLDFLPPGFWRNFGFIGNFSYTKQEGTLPNGQKIRLTNVAKQNLTLVGYYEEGGFGSRLIFNRRGDYFVTGGTAQFDRHVKPRSQLDGVLSYRFKNGLQVALDAYNLTNAMVVQYQEDERLTRNVDYDGRTFTLSLRGQF